MSFIEGVKGVISGIVGAVKAFGPKLITGIKHFTTGVGKVAKTALQGIKKVGSHIITGIGKIGEKVSSYTGKLVGSFMKGVHDVYSITPKVDTTGEVINEVEKKIELPAEPIEETGAKILQDEAGTIEEFGNSPLRYYKHLCEEVKLIKERLDKFTPDQILAAKISGSALQIMACSEKLGMEITPEFANIISQTIMEDLGGKLTPELAAQLIIGLKNLGVTTTNKIVMYLKGEAGVESISIGKIMEKALTDYCSGIGDAKNVINEFKDKTIEHDNKVKEFEKKEEMVDITFEDKDFGVDKEGKQIENSKGN